MEILSVGMRVYIPFQSRMVIGMVVNIHQKKPPFKVKEIAQVLDEQPIMSLEMIKLTGWMSAYYFSSYGEAIQAALPAGLNFISETFVRADIPVIPPDMKPKETEILQALVEAPEMKISMDEMLRRWGNGVKRQISWLQKKDFVSVWEEPKVKVTVRTHTVWYWSEGGLEKSQELITKEEKKNKKQPKWLMALEKLLEMGLPKPKTDLRQDELFSDYVLKRIKDEHVISEVGEEAPDEISSLLHEPHLLKTLNEEQESAYEQILEPLRKEEFKSFLLFGVTGSGKTEVYIHALKSALEMGKGGLVLVPEIALTPQTMRRFYQIFGNQIAILHSRQNERQRYEAWLALHRGEKKIAIGPRSAVFAPVQNLGIILVDEEHDQSYKQEDPAPRYHGRDVALMRGYFENAVVVCGSATPSMNMLHNCTRGKSKLLELSARHAGATMPTVKVIDLKQYKGKAMKGPLAIPVYLAIKERLEKKEQVIILYNRRGFASFLICHSCGEIPQCPNCSVSLTYHKKTRQLRCHYCGHSTREPQHCPACREKDLQEMGSGTQKIEEEIQDLFPEGSVLRMDQDTTSGKDGHSNILGAFGRGEADILLGTQLVSKGLDFPNVTLVVVVNSDTELAYPSYRSSERMYQMLSQVSGRSGRADKPGEVFLQTWKPEQQTFQFVRHHDFKGFARQELQFRKTLLYPPFMKLIKFVFRSGNEQLVGRVAGQMKHSIYKTYSKAIILGPSPAALYRVNRKFVWEMFVKLPQTFGTQNTANFLEAVHTHYENNKPEGASSVRINIHVDSL